MADGAPEDEGAGALQRPAGCTEHDQLDVPGSGLVHDRTTGVSCTHEALQGVHAERVSGRPGALEQAPGLPFLLDEIGVER